MSKKKPKPIIFILPLVLFFGLIIMLYFRLGKPPNIEVNTATSRAVPTFSLPDLAFIEGLRVSDTESDATPKILTNADLPTTPYMLNVWGSWCPTCVVEHPIFMELSQQGVPIVGVNYKDEIVDAHGYLQRYGNPFVLVIRDDDGDLALDLGLTGAPETYIVDTKGIIRQHIVGEVHQDNWTNRIQPCMNALEQTDISDEQIAKMCQ